MADIINMNKERKTPEDVTRDQLREITCAFLVIGWIGYWLGDPDFEFDADAKAAMDQAVEQIMETMTEEDRKMFLEDTDSFIKFKELLRGVMEEMDKME